MNVYTFTVHKKVYVPIGLVVLLLALLLLPGCGGSNSKKTPSIELLNTVTLASGEAIVFDENVQIPMRDGAVLSANVFRPVAKGDYPIIMAVTPYNKNTLHIDEHDIDENGEINISEYTPFELPDPAFWVPNGYAVVVVDARGMGASEGDMSLLTDTEAEDYYDAIEWLAVQEWSNGNVGLNGVSYMAVNQWRVAQLQPPHLKAIMPWEGFTDVYRDTLYHGGIRDDGFLPAWWEFRILENKAPSSEDQNLPKQIIENPLVNDFYRSLSPQNLDDITVPAYVAVSWPDHGLHTRGTLLGFEQISSEDKWLEIHGRKKWEWYYSGEAQARQLQFFDYFLLGKDSGMLEQPRVSYELRSGYYQGTTQTASEWPVPSLRTETLYLDAATSNMANTALANQASVTYIADNTVDLEAVTPSQQVEFTYTFTEDTQITGGMNLHLWISIDGSDDTDMFVGIQKIDSQGEYVSFEGNGVEDGQVANGWLRASHRALDMALSIPTRPFHTHAIEEKIAANQIVPVQIEILPSSTLFEVGERLSIIIQGVDILESGLDEHQSISAGEVTIYSGGNYPSRLVYAADSE